MNRILQILCFFVLFITAVLILSSCSEKALLARKARRNHDRDEKNVLKARERNPEIIVEQFDRMIKNGEIENKVIYVHDTIKIPGKAIVQVLKPEKVIDHKREAFLIDSMASVITNIAFNNSLEKDSLARILFKKETALILQSKKNCPELTGKYVYYDPKTEITTTAIFENGVIKETIQTKDGVVINPVGIRTVLIKGKDTETEHIPFWAWVAMGGLAALALFFKFFRR